MGALSLSCCFPVVSAVFTASPVRASHSAMEEESVHPQPKAKAAPKLRARRKVELQDIAALKQRKDTLKKELKELHAQCRVQMQKRRRLLKRAGNLDADDLAWLQEQARLKRAENRA